MKVFGTFVRCSQRFKWDFINDAYSDAVNSMKICEITLAKDYLWNFLIENLIRIFCLYIIKKSWRSLG